ncbi:hypothetical protein [Nonomuraea wenchangensis]|uniref:hypothetical protein n=1 Tax=Nonomuraea wenchangensis TaxID=568860 RepID=UPI003331AB6A
MLKEACAVSALVAAALVPSMPSQAQAANAGATTSSIDSSATQAPKCKWLEENGKRCYYCRGEKGSGYKRQYCERRRSEPRMRGNESQMHGNESQMRGNKSQMRGNMPHGPMSLECVTTKKPTTNSPNRTCKTCKDASTGKQVYQECNS